MTDELRPYLLCRREGQEAVCATWRLEIGNHQSLVFFTSSELAEQYRETSGMEEDWRVVHPDRATLGEMLRGSCEQQSIQYAVLDPTVDSARRVFEIRPMVEQIEAEQRGE